MERGKRCDILAHLHLDCEGWCVAEAVWAESTLTAMADILSLVLWTAGMCESVLNANVTLHMQPWVPVARNAF